MSFRVWSACLALFLAMPAQAATRYVGGCGSPNSATIAAAVAAVSAGDTILVCPGTYNEAVTINKDNLTIRSSTGNRADVTVSNNGIPFTLTGATIALKDMTVTSTNNRGISRGWTASPSAYTFENLAVTAKDQGVYIDVSAKVTFTNVNVTSSNDSAIELRGSADGAHVFDTVAASGKKYGIYTYNGGATFKDVTATATDNDAIYMTPRYDATFTNVTATSSNDDGINMGWVSSGKTHSFSNVNVTAKNRGIYIDVSGKVTFSNVSATSSNDDGIRLAWGSQGQHVFDTVAASGKKYGIYSSHGGVTFKDITVTASDNDALYLSPEYDAVFTNITASSSQGNGIYMTWAASGKTLDLSGLNVSAKERGVYVEASAALSLRNAAVSSSNDDAVYLAYGAQGAHVLDNLTLDAPNGNGIYFGASVPSSTIGNVCVNSSQKAIYVQQWGAQNVTISASKFVSTSYGVQTAANPSFKTTVSGSCFMKSSAPRAYSNSTSHKFDGNYWQGVAGGTTYIDGNVRDNGTLASCPVTSCYAAPVPAPVAEYRFDECAWTSGAADAVADSVGSYHGTPYSVTTAAGGVVQRAADLSASGTADYIHWPIGLLNGRTDFTISVWFKTSVTQSQQEILHGLGSSTGDDEIEIYLVNATRIRVNLFDNGNNYDAASSFVDGSWHHLAVTRSGTSVCVYLDATSLGCNTRDSGALSITNANALLTGQEQDSFGGSFSDGQSLRAQLDELKVFASALGSSQIASIRTNELAGNNYDGTTRSLACVAGPDHIRIEHSGAAVTCLREPVTIKACQNADCSTLYSSGSVSLTLSPSGGWYDAASGGTASDALTFTGSATRYLERTTTGTVTLSASGISPTPANGVKCYVGGSENCSLAFSDAGFIVSATAGGGEATIPTQTAGTGSATYYLRAVKTSTTTQACEAALTGANTVNFAYECLNPATCYGANLMNVNGGTDTTISRNDSGSVASYTSVAMTFDANGNAPFTFNYSDVGQVKLHMAKAAGGSLVKALSGSSNAFVVKPSGFVLSGIQQTALPNLANPGASDGSGAKFVKAGEAFSATVTAKAGSGTAYSFGRESTPEGVTLTRALVEPSGGSPGTLAGGTIAGGSFTDGVATASSLSWSEVGIITLTPANDDYLGVGSVTGTISGNIGRFYPDHFDTEVTHACVAGGFTYSGQPFPLKVTAKNLAGGTTANYTGGFAKTVTLSDANGAAGAFSPATLVAGDFASGVADLTATPSVSFAFASKLTAPATLKVRGTDGDGASSSGGTEGTTPLRSGRLWLGNAYGSDRQNLSMPFEAQYWNGSAFVTNTIDSCTAFAAGNVALGNLQGGLGGYTGPATPGAISAGKGSIVLTKPASAASGSVDVVVNLGATGSPSDCPGMGGGTSAAKSYLAGKWCGASYDRNPAARATFGIFGSSLRKGTIYLRESH